MQGRSRAGLLFWDGCPLMRKGVRHIRTPEVWVRAKLVVAEQEEERKAGEGERGGAGQAALRVGQQARVLIEVANLGTRSVEDLTLQIRQAEGHGDPRAVWKPPAVAPDAQACADTRLWVLFAGVLDSVLLGLGKGETRTSGLGVCVMEPGWLSLAARVVRGDGCVLFDALVLHVLCTDQ